MFNVRRFIVSLTALPCLSPLYAAPVTQTQAEAIARQFVEARGMQHASAQRVKVCRQLSVAKDINRASSAYYVFNVGANDGYVVIGGDDRAEQVLGYADKGHLDAANMPDGLKDLLASYEEEIAAMDSGNDFLNTRAMQRQAAKGSVKNNVSVLLDCTWGQEQPYYDLIPGNNPVGCVATALGQIFKYHKWPESTTVEIPSYTYGGVKYDALPPTTFNWDIIADNYENYYDKDSRAEVAKLMQYLGYSVKMQYTNGSSGTYNELVPYALATYFGYPDARLRSRSDYSLSEWEDLVYHELTTNGPVFYTAQGNLLQGHAFVCDGYEGDGYFHFNWGWYGDLNGYFKLSAFNVSSSNISQLNWKHNIVTGIHRPDAGVAQDEPLRLISQGCSTTDDGKVFTRKYSTDEYGPLNIFDNRTAALPKTADMEYTFAVFKDGVMTDVLTDYMETKSGVQSNSFSRNVKVYFGSTLADGDYELRCVSREKGTEQWQEDAGGDMHHIALHVENKSLVAKSYFSGRDLDVRSVAYAGKRDGRYMYTLDITNGGYQYDGSVFFMTKAEDSRSQEASFLMQPQEHKFARVALNRELVGGDSLKVALDFMGASLVYDNKLDSVTSKITAEVQPVNMADGNILSGYFGFKAKVTNSGNRDYHGGIGWRLYRCSDNKLVYEQAYDADLTPGQTVDGDYMVTVNPLTFYKSYANKQYVVKLVAYGFNVDADGKWVDAQELYSTDPLTLKPGVVYYDDRGKVISAVEATDKVQVPDGVTTVDLQYTAGDVKTVEPNANPECLYVTYWRDAQPTGLDGCNYVKSDKAENIVLAAGKGFYSPVDFTADKVKFTYSVEPDKWQTLAMPIDMDVNDMEADGIFVKEFRGGDNTTVYFDDAQKIVAWQPLLVAGKAGERTVEATNAHFAQGQTGITEASHYWFCMTTASSVDEGDYLLSADSKTFVSGNSSIASTIKPFGAYFKPSPTNNAPAEVLNIVVEGKDAGITDGISETKNADRQTVVARYSVDGRQVGKSARGIIIERHADGTCTKIRR